MGLFDLFRKQSIEHLPENDQELEELYKKYCFKKDEKSKNIGKSILLKAYELYEDKNDFSHWAVSSYCLLYGNKEEQDAYYNFKAKKYFDEFIKELDRFILSDSLSDKELLDKCPVFLSTAGDHNTFVYYENPDRYHQYLSNALYNYYTKNLTYLIRKVMELLDKQIENHSICLSGFYMYKDLEKFFLYETKDYNNYIFEQAHQYTRNLRHYLEYKCADKNNKKRYQEYSMEYERMHKYALNQLNTVDYKGLLDIYESYKNIRKFIKENRIVFRVVEKDYSEGCYYLEKVHRDFNEDRSLKLLRTGKSFVFNAESFGENGKTKVYGKNRYAVDMNGDYHLKIGDIFYSEIDQIKELQEAKENGTLYDELLHDIKKIKDKV